MSSVAPALALDRQHLLDWYRRNRDAPRQLFDLLDPAAYYTRPIALRNPIVFYEGHLPAFSVIALVKRGLGHPGVDARLERLFERGIDPDSVDQAVPRSGAGTIWPSRDEVLAFGARADDASLDAIAHAEFDCRVTIIARCVAARRFSPRSSTRRCTRRRSCTCGIDSRMSRSAAPGALHYERGGEPPRRGAVAIPAGRATLGADRAAILFGWDNEFDAHHVDVGPFEIDVDNVTNAEFLEFIDAGGYETRALWSEDGWHWREQESVTHPAFWVRDGRPMVVARHVRDLALPAGWPVYVSHAEAAAFARWRGRRLPTEAEYHRAAYGTPDGRERALPWGASAPDAARGNFDFASWEPVPVGSRPAGASALGVHDLVGNGWEWTSTVFGPFPGFEPMASYPEYSADFFDGQHYVMKGASPATARELVRRSFRNWFRPNYPYVYAKFRTAAAAAAA